MHTLWKGAINFGLVNVPVKMFSATEEKDIAFKQIHKGCGHPISTSRNCPNCLHEVNSEDIARGFQYDKDTFVIFEKEELEQLTGDKNKEIRILDFVECQDIDPVFYQRTYYLAPEGIGVRAYYLLHQAMSLTGKIAICKVSIRSKTNLALLRTSINCIILETIFFPDEVRSLTEVPNLPLNIDLTQKEIDLAQQLINKLSTRFIPDNYKDEKRESIIKAIQKKLSGEEIQIIVDQPRSKILDLMSSLEASLEMYKPEQPVKKKRISRSNKETSDPKESVS